LLKLGYINEQRLLNFFQSKQRVVGSSFSCSEAILIICGSGCSGVLPK